jgi:hypothetical protein
MNSRILRLCVMIVALLIFGATSSLLAPVAQAQFVSFTQASQHHGSAAIPVGWTLLQDVGSIAITNGCATGGPACTFDVNPMTAGSVGVVFTYTGNNVFISSASITGATFHACPAGGSFNESCNAFNATGGSVDAEWETGHTAGTSSVTVTLSGSPTGEYFAEFVEIAPPPGQTVTGLDASGSVINTSCTTCSGIALTTTATDAIIQGAFNSAQFVNAWNSVSSPYFIDHANSIFAQNVAPGSLSAPVLTMAAAGSVPFSALAFKSSAGTFTTTTPLFNLVNFTIVANASNVPCSPACTALTIPSTTSGNLLFVATATAAGSTSISSVSDGGDTFTLCSGANITPTAQAESLSCAWTVTSGGKTSVTITNTGSGGTGIGVFEVSRTGGSWTLDAQGSTQRAAFGSSPAFYTGQALSLTGSNDACFQGFYNTGGAITVTGYPFAYTIAPLGGTFILNAEASEVFLPGTYYGADAGTGAAPAWITNQNVVSAVNGVCFK